MTSSSPSIFTYPARRQKDQSDSAASLEEEIQMLRKITRRVFELADSVTELDQALNLLGAVGIASTRLANLLKAQKSLGTEQDPMMVALSEVLDKVRKDWAREKMEVLEGAQTPEGPKDSETQQSLEKKVASDKPGWPSEAGYGNG